MRPIYFKRNLNLFFSLLFTFSVTQSFSQTFTTKSLGKNIKTQGIVFYSANEGYMCGDQGSIFKINADGSTTELTTPTTEDLWRISVIPNTNGQGFIAVGDNNTVLKSTDGGQTITPLTIPQATGSFVFGVQCMDADTYFVAGGDFGVGKGTVLKTTDGGNNWVKSTLDGSLFIDNVFFVDANAGYAVGGGPMNGEIFKTTDGGVIWSSVLSTASLMVNVYCHDADNVVAVGLGGQIYKTDNGGQSWFDKKQGNIDYYGVEFVNASIGYVSGGTTSSVLLKTTDGGENWQAATVPNIGVLWNMAASSDKLAVVGSDGEWAIANSPTLSGKTIETSSTNIYPNPSNGFITVSTDITDEIEVTIQTIEGKLVYQNKLVNNNNKTLDVSVLNSGVYIMRLSTGNHIFKTQKLIIN